MITLFEAYTKKIKISPTDELLHLIYDQIITEWEKIRTDRTRKDLSFDIKNFKKVSISKVQKLIDKGADINVHDPANNWGSLLMMSVDLQDFNLIKCLVENGADLEAHNSCNSTAIYSAAGIKSSISGKILKYLIEQGADINTPNNSGVLPIFHATFNKAYENAIILLKAGCFIETTFNPHMNRKNDLNGWTKGKNYPFQKLLCEMYPDEISKFDDNKIHKKIREEYGYLFSSNKYNL